MLEKQTNEAELRPEVSEFTHSKDEGILAQTAHLTFGDTFEAKKDVRLV